MTAHEVEQSVLSWWRDEHDVSLVESAREVLPHGGWTEVASLIEAGVDECVRRVEMLVGGS